MTIAITSVLDKPIKKKKIKTSPGRWRGLLVNCLWCHKDNQYELNNSLGFIHSQTNLSTTKILQQLSIVEQQ